MTRATAREPPAKAEVLSGPPSILLRLVTFPKRKRAGGARASMDDELLRKGPK